MPRIEVLAPEPTDPDIQALMRRLISLRVNPMFNIDRIPSTVEIRNTPGLVCVDYPDSHERRLIDTSRYMPEVHIPVAIVTDIPTGSDYSKAIAYIEIALETTNRKDECENKIILSQVKNYFNSSFCCPIN